MHSWDADGAPIFMYGGMDMKKLMALLLALVCLFGSAVSESPATPTDLIEIEDDDWGYIDIPLERKVYIIIDKEPAYLGDTITLYAILVDFLPEDEVSFNWQYALEKDNTEWTLIEDAYEQSYTFVLDETNMDYWYRVVVKVGE